MRRRSSRPTFTSFFLSLLPIHFSCPYLFILHSQVRELVSECQCPSQFPMIRVSDGKYRIGDTKVLIFVRVSSEIDPFLGAMFST